MAGRLPSARSKTTKSGGRWLTLSDALGVLPFVHQIWSKRRAQADHEARRLPWQGSHAHLEKSVVIEEISRAAAGQRPRSVRDNGPEELPDSPRGIPNEGRDDESRSL